jgi:hypothetical protein
MVVSRVVVGEMVQGVVGMVQEVAQRVEVL